VTHTTCHKRNRHNNVVWAQNHLEHGQEPAWYRMHALDECRGKKAELQHTKEGAQCSHLNNK
jgi:hypothetical protein